MVLFRCTFILIISASKIIRKGGKFIPSNFKPYIKRNVLEAIVILGLFHSMQMIPISFYNIIFNMKGLFCFFFEAYWNKRAPRLAYIILSLFSFAGLFMMMYPNMSKSESSSESSNYTNLSVYGLLYTLGFTVLVSYTDVYTQIICKIHKHPKLTGTPISFILECSQAWFPHWWSLSQLTTPLPLSSYPPFRQGWLGFCVWQVLECNVSLYCKYSFSIFIIVSIDLGSKSYYSLIQLYILEFI